LICPDHSATSLVDGLDSVATTAFRFVILLVSFLPLSGAGRQLVSDRKQHAASANETQAPRKRKSRISMNHVGKKFLSKKPLRLPCVTGLAVARTGMPKSTWGPRDVAALRRCINKTKSQKTLANICGVCPSTLTRWLTGSKPRNPGDVRLAITEFAKWLQA